MRDERVKRREVEVGDGVIGGTKERGRGESRERYRERESDICIMRLLKP